MSIGFQRVVFWVVVAVLALLLLRANDGSGGMPENCGYTDYGRDAYVDCGK